MACKDDSKQSGDNWWWMWVVDWYTILHTVANGSHGFSLEYGAILGSLTIKSFDITNTPYSWDYDSLFMRIRGGQQCPYIGSEVTTKLWFNIPVLYEFVSISEVYKIA